MASAFPLRVGVDVRSVPDLPHLLSSVLSIGPPFLSIPLVHPRNTRDAQGEQTGADLEPLTRTDTVLTSSQWSGHITGKISHWIRLDSSDEAVRRTAEASFDQEFAFAAHLGLGAVHVELRPSALGQSNLARKVLASLLSAPQVGIVLRVAMDQWEDYNKVRLLAGGHPSLGVCIEIPAELPSEAVCDRWVGEAVKACILPLGIFLFNKAGFPTLSKKHQGLLHRLFNFNVTIFLSGRPNHAEGIAAYHTYLTYLHHNWAGQVSAEEAEIASYLDYLQAPLQPLGDNLESQTYETFERDPIKYQLYQDAVYEAIQDRQRAGLARDAAVVIMVVGAGRGPLVKASLRAAERSDQAVKVYAVEKNPNAVVTLRNLRNTEWGNKVTVVSHDMRSWDAPEKCDFMVSELLGSFGDNELSPECLMGAQKYLKPDGISIPYRYTSYVSPVMSGKLHNEVAAYGDLAHWETGYVVKLHNFFALADPKPCFTFHHPDWEHRTLTRYHKMDFAAREAATLHGLAGYFDCYLYKDINYSIHPLTHTEGMFSWFPIFWPLRMPIQVHKGQTVTVEFWRLGDPKKVWYEWAVTAPEASPVHNPRGRSYGINL
jgi:protein arginine N-methyltransferase 5